jgi:hypothetical protein
LSNLTAQTNDQVKGQNSYRIYAGATVGWVGTLNYMRAGEGFMYNSAATAGKTFNYPSTTSQVYHAPMRIVERTADNRWEADIHKYSNTMTMTSVVLENEVELQSDQIEIAAFDANNECRGSIMLQNVPEIAAHPYLGFLMVFGEQGESLTLKVYNHAAGTEYTASNVVTFAPDAIHGTPTEPYRISGQANGLNDITVQQITVYPNPVKDLLQINHNLANIDLLQVIDITGRIILEKANFVEKTLNVSSLANGVYLLRLTKDNETVTIKVTKK